MPSVTALKFMADLDNAKLAAATGEDPVSLYLFEKGIAPISYDLANAICERLDVTLEDMFPELEGVFAQVEDCKTEEEMQALFLSPPNKVALRAAGIDPDFTEWVLVVDLESGVERRYPVSSIEMEKIVGDIRQMSSEDRYVTFYSDCQQVVLRVEAAFEMAFVPGASVARFNSNERAFAITVVRDGSPRAELCHVTPDGGDDGAGARPFARLLQAAMNGESLPAFVEIGDDTGELRFIRTGDLDLIEIPFGVIYPDVYGGPGDVADSQADETLEMMEAVGSA